MCIRDRCKQQSVKLWKLLNTENYISTLGSLSGNQAVQHAKAGLKSIYLSGWQVAADANSAGEMYPDQSLYPYDSAPKLVESMNNALLRADQIQHMELKDGDMKKEKRIDYMLPIIADGEAGFGGPLNVFELTKKFIKAGAAGVHFEDQLASEKKCGHMGGKVLVPTGTMIKNLKAARLAADIADVPLIILARTDANAAKLITNDFDENDKPFLTGERSPEGFYYVKAGIDQAISRGLAYAPYSDLIWCETATPNLEEAKKFADAVHDKFPGKLLAYNCSPSFNWKKHLNDDEIASFLESDPLLASAIEEAHQRFQLMAQEYPDLYLGSNEKSLIEELQSGFVNFYNPATVNPYVALGARGPWVITSHGAVVHDNGGYGMLGAGHGPERVIQSMSDNWVMANVMTASFSQKRLDERLRRELGHTRGSVSYTHLTLPTILLV